MHIISINSCNYGSTGNAMLQLAQTAKKRGHTVFTCIPFNRSNNKKQVENQIFIGNRIINNMHILLAKYTGLNGCFSVVSTYLFLRKIKALGVDMLHMHNLHNCYINLPMLFSFIKKYKIPVVWTLHDCFAFTGKCPHFIFEKCLKWQDGCFCCPQLSKYPETVLDTTKLLWKLKKKWFCDVENMTIVTPSHWLEGLVKQSFLKEYPTKVISNGIDLDVFKPRESNFLKEYGLLNKHIVLGVAFTWSYKKGIDIFKKLALNLGNDYKIVLVGTNKLIEKDLPKTILCVGKAQSEELLAQIYSSASVFVNPTREETFGLVNVEALACGTPVVTFDSGGSRECIDTSCGKLVECDNFDSMVYHIKDICENNTLSKDNCINRAKLFDKNVMLRKYMELYNI